MARSSLLTNFLAPLLVNITEGLESIINVKVVTENPAPPLTNYLPGLVESESLLVGTTAHGSSPRLCTAVDPHCRNPKTMGRRPKNHNLATPVRPPKTNPRGTFLIDGRSHSHQGPL